MNCPDNYKECERYHEDNDIENQCITDSTVGRCMKKIYPHWEVFPE